MTIIIDYDNSIVRIHKTYEKHAIIIKVHYPSEIHAVLTEILNMYDPINVTLQRQDDGEIRTIEEW